MTDFYIPSDWRVLVLEDTEERISWFRQRLPHAVFVKTAKEAIHALNHNAFKVLFLDHDLHWMHADPSVFDGTGKEVARFLASAGFDGIVVIHSKNGDGASAMRRFLPNAKLVPFGSFEINSPKV